MQPYSGENSNISNGALYNCGDNASSEARSYHALIASTIISLGLLLIEQVLAKSSCPSNSLTELMVSSLRSAISHKTPHTTPPFDLPPPQPFPEVDL